MRVIQATAYYTHNTPPQTAISARNKNFVRAQIKQTNIFLSYTKFFLLANNLIKKYCEVEHLRGVGKVKVCLGAPISRLLFLYFNKLCLTEASTPALRNFRVTPTPLKL